MVNMLLLLHKLFVLIFASYVKPAPGLQNLYESRKPSILTAHCKLLDGTKET